jgi:hypothetical protein
MFREGLRADWARERTPGATVAHDGRQQNGPRGLHGSCRGTEQMRSTGSVVSNALAHATALFDLHVYVWVALYHANVPVADNAT